MSVATKRSVFKTSRLVPMLTPLYDAQQNQFCAPKDGIYRCGTNADCEFHLESQGAEAEHCTFERRGGTFAVDHINGRVWINDLPVRGKNYLSDGDVITLGPASFLLSLEEPTTQLSPEHLEALENTSRLLSVGSFAASSAVHHTINAGPANDGHSPTLSGAPLADTSLSQLAAIKEQEAERKQLAIRQQQLDELLETIRIRERNAESRLASIEERSLQLSSQWSELLRKQQELVTHEGELVKCSHDVQEQLRELAEAQQRSAQSARENTQTLESIRQASQELALREQAVAEKETAVAEARLATEAKLAAASTEDADTVEKSAAIAAQRDSALLEQELAIKAQAELRQLQQSIEAEQQVLRERQAEIESRADEVAARVRQLKALLRTQQPTALSITDEATSNELTQSLDDKARALDSERAELDRRLAELAVRESQLEDARNAASAIAQTAESERSVLQSAHKDLLCERNTLSQLRQDLASKEAGIAEREVLAAHQLEELRTRFAALDQRASELKQHESEISNRSAEVHRRVKQLKEEQRIHAEALQRNESGESAAAAANEELISVRQQLDEVRQDLATSEEQINAHAAEREALLSAVRELQKALLDAQQDLEDANRVKSEAARQKQRLEEALQTIEENTTRLQQMESEQSQASNQVSDLEEQLRLRDIEILRLEDEVKTSAANKLVSSNDDAQLIDELNHAQESLKEQLSAAESLVQQRDEMLRDLQEQFQASKHSGDLEEKLRLRDIEILRLEEEVKASAAKEPVASNAGAELIDELEQARAALEVQLATAEELVQQRDAMLRDLQEQLAQKSATPRARAGTESPDILSRELDERAHVLDRRDEELRERSRKIEQSEMDLESERRQLLQARQQLELARAEIQVAMRHQSEPRHRNTASTSIHDDADSDATAVPEVKTTPNTPEPDRFAEAEESNESTAASSADLRSELAGLFGLNKPKVVAPSPPPLPATKSEFVDLSEPGNGQSAVALHFGSNAAKLVESAPNCSDGGEPEPEREENSDDFVRDYMEQLLSRNRKTAGNVLPGELKAAEKKPQPAPASAENPKAKKGARVTSYIEQYMAGNMGNLDGDGALSMTQPEDAASDAPLATEEIPTHQRQKMDLQKLKANMDSFRALSAQSVEKALASHAKRVSNHGLNSRIAFATILVILTIVLAIANYNDAIEAPMLMWVTMTAAIGVLSELLRRYSLTRTRVETQRKLRKHAEASAASRGKLESTEVEQATHVEPKTAATNDRELRIRTDVEMLIPEGIDFAPNSTANRMEVGTSSLD